MLLAMEQIKEVPEGVLICILGESLRANLGHLSFPIYPVKVFLFCHSYVTPLTNCGETEIGVKEVGGDS